MTSTEPRFVAMTDRGSACLGADDIVLLVEEMDMDALALPRDRR